MEKQEKYLLDISSHVSMKTCCGVLIRNMEKQEKNLLDISSHFLHKNMLWVLIRNMEKKKNIFLISPLISPCSDVVGSH